MSQELKELKEQNTNTYIKLLKDMNEKYTKYTKMLEDNILLKKLNQITIENEEEVTDLKIDYDESRENFDKFIAATKPEFMNMDAISYDGGSIHHSRRHRRRRITKKKSRKMRRTRRKHRHNSSGRR